MSKVYFRNIEKEDLNQVFVLLNQLKPMDISKVDPEISKIYEENICYKTSTQRK